MEVGSEKDYTIVCGVVGHTEFHCDGVCSELVHGDFPETFVGNCVLLQELRRKILQRYHDSIPLGHPGQLRTQEIVQRDYWWPGMHTFIKNYVEGCAVCQQHKINRHLSNPALQPVKSENTRPFSLISMDFITDLLPSEGFDSIMVVVDHGSTKGVILEPCNKTIDTTGTATILLNSVYRRYGLPVRGHNFRPSSPENSRAQTPYVPPHRRQSHNHPPSPPPP